nr:unnamed protein product [Callosobruchus analis]
MEVNRLLSDELTYELQARGLPIGNTVAEKRLLLRESLRQERLGLSTPPTRCNMVADHELVVCTGKLGELRRAVGQFDDSNRDNEFRRIYTRLTHVSDRLKRIECVTPLLEAQRASLISDANELVRELNLAYEEAREVVAEELQTKGATVAEHPQIDACVRESLGQDRKDSSLHESMPRDLIDLSDSGSLGAFQATQQDNSLIDMPMTCFLWCYTSRRSEIENHHPGTLKLPLENRDVYFVEALPNFTMMNDPHRIKPFQPDRASKRVMAFIKHPRSS